MPGHFNDIADFISHFQQTRFRGLAPHADHQSQPLPEELFQLALLAQGTIKTYSSGEKQFTNFYYQFYLHKHVPLLPTMENILIYFAVFLAKTVNPDTIKVHLAALHHMQLVNGYNLVIYCYLHNSSCHGIKIVCHDIFNRQIVFEI